MDRSSVFKRSPEDEATFRKWRRGMVLFYGSVGLVVITVVMVAHFADLAMHVASR